MRTVGGSQSCEDSIWKRKFCYPYKNGTPNSLAIQATAQTIHFKYIYSVSLLCLIYTSAYVSLEALTMDVAQINLVVVTP